MIKWEIRQEIRGIYEEMRTIANAGAAEPPSR